MSQNSSGWVVVGTYEDETGWVSEVMAEGFAGEQDARTARSQMARSCPEVAFDVQTAAYAAKWVTR
jgi:hypothetical protein